MPTYIHTYTYICISIYLVDGAKAPTSKFSAENTHSFCMKNKLQPLLLRERKNFYPFIEYEKAPSLSVRGNLLLRKRLPRGEQPVCSLCSLLCCVLPSPLLIVLSLVLAPFQDTRSHGIPSIFSQKFTSSNTEPNYKLSKKLQQRYLHVSINTSYRSKH